MPFLPRSAWLDRHEPDEPSPGCEFQLAGLALSSLSLSPSLTFKSFWNLCLLQAASFPVSPLNPFTDDAVCPACWQRLAIPGVGLSG